MTNKVYKEGFPRGYRMVQREEDTFLIGPYPDGGSYIGDRGVICVAPKFQQGEEWLKTAQIISASLNLPVRLKEQKKEQEEDLARKYDSIPF